MDPFTQPHRGEPAGRSGHPTRGIVLDRGWRYDLKVWFVDTFVLRGKLKDLRRKVLDLAELDAGQAMLDVGCGTGTLAIDAAARVGAAGRVAGIDPAPRQIARARARAKRAGLAIDFEVAVIEALPFPNGSFDTVTSTLMMHHLPEDLKRQGLSEVLRVLRPGGRLVVADFKRSEHDHRDARHGSGHAGIEDQPDLMRSAGFTEILGEELPLPRTHRRFAGAAIVVGRKPYERGQADIGA